MFYLSVGIAADLQDAIELKLNDVRPNITHEASKLLTTLLIKHLAFSFLPKLVGAYEEGNALVVFGLNLWKISLEYSLSDLNKKIK